MLLFSVIVFITLNLAVGASLNPSGAGVKIVIDGCSDCERRYIIGKEKVVFDVAVQLCSHSGMEIATISTPEEEEELISTWLATNPGGSLRNGSWIGGVRCSGCLSTFEWYTTGKPVIYSDFFPGQPDNANGNENCLQIAGPRSNQTGWNDIRCETLLEFACQTRCC